MLVFTRYPDRDFTLFVSKGNTTLEEWMDSLIQYGAEGISTFELFDLRHHTNLFSSEDIERLLNLTIKNISHRPPNTKTAILVDEAAMYGVSRMYEILTDIGNIEDIVTEVFYDIDKAMEWLGIQMKDTISNPM